MSTQKQDLRTAAQAVIDRWDTPKWKDAPATAGYIAALRDALAAEHTEPPLDMVGRWYMAARDGMAMLCVDREDAEAEARKADRAHPRNGPHRAVQLVEAQAAARPALPEIKDMHNAPQFLNLNDRAMWVIGWNECRDAMRDSAMRTTQPTDRHALQAEGKHPAPCARFCEANAFRADRRSDTALIRQLLEALQASSAALWETKGDPETPVTDAVNAARARLEEKS